MIEIIRRVRAIIGFDGLDMRIGIHTVNIFNKYFREELLVVY